jgi:DNA-binding response OmpR family regulator
MRVLLVADSGELAQTISLVLKVRWPELSLLQADDGRVSIDLIHREKPDLVMLHLDSRAKDGFDLISQIRAFSEVPLIVLSQKDDVMDKVRALEMGADEWIAPSSVPMEFIAKVNAILRRCSSLSNRPASSFLNGKLRIDYATRRVTVLGRPVKLTPIEYKILCQLVRNEGSVVSHSNLLQTVWGPNYGADPEFVKKYIHRLRSKVEEDPADPQMILTERGVGYILIRSCDWTE